MRYHFFVLVPAYLLFGLSDKDIEITGAVITAAFTAVVALRKISASTRRAEIKSMSERADVLYARFEKQLAASDERYAALEKKYNEQQTRLEDVENKYHELREKYENLRDDHERCEQKHTDAMSEIESLKLRLNIPSK